MLLGFHYLCIQVSSQVLFQVLFSVFNFLILSTYSKRNNSGKLIWRNSTVN